MTATFGLHSKVNYTSVKALENACLLLSNYKIKWLWLSGDMMALRKDLILVNKLLTDYCINIITDSIEILNSPISCKAFICRQYEDIATLKTTYTNILIGGLANDIAACKNVEYYEGDFVYFGPVDEIGLEPFTTLIPKEPDYEWRFLDIIIPVIGYGRVNSSNLTTLTETANLSGFMSPIETIDNHAKQTLRFVLD
ncbi:MAG: hypothetical protein R3279_05220 [Putridiphycobacter sp.]|nr:hypothetical protein [Putridiphycobacter sp.]